MNCAQNRKSFALERLPLYGNDDTEGLIKPVKGNCALVYTFLLTQICGWFAHLIQGV